MSIEKMQYVNIVGLESRLDSVLLKIVESQCFHIEQSIKAITESDDSFRQLKEANPYNSLLKRIQNLDFGREFKYNVTEFCEIEDKSIEEIDDFVKNMEKETQSIRKEINELKDYLKECEQALIQLNHLQNMQINLEKLYHIKHIRMRFGKLPVDSYPKLRYFNDKNFEFVSYDNDGSYYWGMYFSPLESTPVADKIMKTLYFERIWVPDFITGTPQEEVEKLQGTINETRQKLEEARKKRTKLIEDNRQMLDMVYCRITFLYNIFSLRSYASILKDKFYLVGFIPKKKVDYFKRLFADLPDVSLVIKPPEIEPRFSTPVRLKNNAFSKPFSMFVEMYGLPSYNGFNPTNFVAITYTLLFGIMFGDLGQGLLLALLGFIIYKKKKNEFAAILTRIGISSAVFGLLYGSVFGFEHLLEPFYHGLGLKHKPLEVMGNTNLILAGAIAIGISLIIISILINIIINMRKKEYDEALFANNGVAGLIFYCSILVGIVSGMMLGKNLFNPVYIIFLLVLPIIIMFFREPLGYMVSGKRYKIENVGDFIASNFFEVFEFLLGYATNTLSFVRIGGFVFSHAGMMSVVMILSETVSKGASPIVIIIGNLFVMGMEGMIVGIQVLRLEFYEIFSRFYDGDGRAFEPVTINYEPIIE